MGERFERLQFRFYCLWCSLTRLKRYFWVVWHDDDCDWSYLLWFMELKFRAWRISTGTSVGKSECGS